MVKVWYLKGIFHSLSSFTREYLITWNSGEARPSIPPLHIAVLVLTFASLEAALFIGTTLPEMPTLFFASTSWRSGDARSSLNGSKTCVRAGGGTTEGVVGDARCGCGACIGVWAVGKEVDGARTGGLNGYAFTGRGYWDGGGVCCSGARFMFVKGWVLNGSNDAGRPCDEDILKTLKEDSKTKNLGEWRERKNWTRWAFLYWK